MKGRRVITEREMRGRRNREEGRGDRQRGTGVTAILYLARHDRVNELCLRGGPTMGYSLPSGPLPCANYNPIWPNYRSLAITSRSRF